MNPPMYTFLLRGLSEIDKYGPPLYTLVRRGYLLSAQIPLARCFCPDCHVI